MSKSRTLLIAAVSCVSVAVFATQVALPSLLAGHLKALQEAQSVSGTLNIQPLPGTPKTIKFTYSKPNLMKVESDEGFTLCDGTSVYTYVKATNKYTVEPVTEAELASKAGMMDVWAWAAFFNKDAFKDTASKVGGKRTLKGNKVTEVTVEWQKPTPGTATLYIDEKTGVATGCNIKMGEAESLILAENVTLGKDPSDKALYAFVAPSGSTKVEALEAPKAGWAGVQAILKKSCMPCHNAQNRKSGINLSDYDSVVGNSQAVVPGEPEQSGIYRTTSGSRPSMPKQNSPLTKAETQAIYDWIKAGAKQD